MTDAVTCRSGFGDPLLVCDIWEFWHSFHQSVIDYERKETFYPVYTLVLQCALQIARLPDRVDRENAVFVRKVRREVRDLLSCCLYILGGKQFLPSSNPTFKTLPTWSAVFGPSTCVQMNSRAKTLVDLSSYLPMGSHYEIHKQLLTLMKRFPHLASLDYISQHLSGHFECDAARVLDAIVGINEPFITSIYDFVKDLVTQTTSKELKVSLCSTFAKLESLPACQLVSLLESTVQTLLQLHQSGDQIL